MLGCPLMGVVHSSLYSVQPQKCGGPEAGLVEIGQEIWGQGRGLLWVYKYGGLS